MAGGRRGWARSEKKGKLRKLIKLKNKKIKKIKELKIKGPPGSLRNPDPPPLLHISETLIDVTHGLKHKWGFHGPPPGGPWDPDSHVSQSLVECGEFSGTWWNLVCFLHLQGVW